VCCPDCDGAAKRVFSPVGVVFKGSGFHSTDYKAKPSETASDCPSKDSGSEKCSGCPAASAE
jgi:predicted nucleic acid-binding Zn ribbon protein